ncbi:MAG TPA: chemotaxis protein CheB [Polyangia bacterium]|nr:chemotaxis protein CheB [Polyangia bacterium]
MDQPSQPEPSIPSELPAAILPAALPPYVVGIGASAGGLEALERFFDSLPDNTGMAFVVVQHLSPDFKSLMDELLARHTTLPIHLVEDGMRVEADHVYLIPPRMEMIISEGRLLLSERAPQPEFTLPIDVFFRSLARDCGPRAVAIVLSGGGSDGSRGIRDVREAGGLVVVQDTSSAQFDGMPKTAREAGVAHWVLAPEEMPHALLEHKSSRLAPPAAGSEATARQGNDPGGIEAVYQMLEEEFGIDFTHYKPSTITRRIERRLALAQSPHIDEYVQRLRGDRDELNVLYRDLLIGVTHFFRDTAAFEMLENKVLPELLAQEPRTDPLRIWVAGCATGEEAYSLAIVLQDLMLKLGERPVKIFATDVHRGSLECAARAIYEGDALAHVSPERLSRYFLRIGDTYQVVPDLRKMIVFAQHNVMKDAPFTRVDLITCRNLLIYLQPAAQQKVLSLFHFALKRGGRLFLGPSETVGPMAHDFQVVDKHWRFYQKHNDIRMTLDTPIRPPPHGELRHIVPPPPYAARQSLTQLLGTYDALLDEVMPPSLLVTDHGELVHAFSGASRFLRMRDGRQDLDVLDVVDAELKMVLVGGIKRALNEPAPLVFRGVRIETNGEPGQYDVSIRRVRTRNRGIPHVLIAFTGSEQAARPIPPPPTEIHLDQISREQLVGLEAELSHTKDNLQSAIEEMETSNEELQAANEELQASNEELQSTNEELQSVNEELYTVNAEYQRKIAELTELTNDMDNLLTSTEVGTVFLDRQLKIRKFTPQIAATFDLMPQDVGRPIETFTSKLDHPELGDDLKQVLATAQPVERELRDVGGKTFFLRIFPYRAKGTVDGVVLTLIDVSGLKAAEDALFHERHLLNSLLFSVPDAIYFKDARGKFIRANKPMAARLGLRDPDDVAGKTARDLPDEDAAQALHKQDESILRTGEAQHYRLEARRDGEGGNQWDLVTRLPLRDANGRIVGTTGIFRDVTEQTRAEEKIREAVRRRDQFLAMLSHELRNPLGAIVSATALLKTDNGSESRANKFLQILERQSQQMTRLLDDLLEASRVTQNKIELKKRVTDLNHVVREAIEVVRGQMEARDIQLSSELTSEPFSVDGDSARLQQVLVNLLNNAAKYTARGGNVVVRTKCDGPSATISVRDDGAGIPADMLESVFDLFVQSSRTLDRAAGGLGVGLSLVRSLVDMHGGSVSAHSDGEGKGSEFVVRLPLCSASPAEPHPRDQPDETGTSRTCVVPKGATIMIVEDNADSREMLCELLELQGFKCHPAENGAAALALLDHLRPDVAILDVGLPEIDGFELARRIRARRELAHACLIALTGYGQPSDRAIGREAGFDAHLVKPVRVERLLELLAQMQPKAGRGHGRPAARTQTTEDIAESES